MSTWESVNGTVAVAAWPAVVLIVVLTLRTPIRGLLNRVHEAEAFGARIKAERVAEATGNFNEHAASVVHTPSDNGTQVRSGDHEPASLNGKVEPGDGAAGYSREQVAEFVRAAAGAGYAVGASRMFLSVPEPVLGWSGKDGRAPMIRYWRGRRFDAPDHSSPMGAGSQGELVQRLENEIRNLTLEDHSAPSGAARIASGRSGAIKELKQQLRALDPSSPWAE